ncbi:hypothetical protein [Anaerosporobacter sp.]|uniref:hypothetical protein n=1 Tax=Anaerosporobacter sp. TaxID=1872529 RepID=UPI00286F02F7|nr:hypothetical protein [Anaerosporobacter sp.]
MKQKRRFRINKYNGAVCLVVLISIVIVFLYIIQFKKQEEQFFKLYNQELQIKNELLAENAMLSMQSDVINGDNRDKLIVYMDKENFIDDVAWIYVANGDTVIYYKNHNLIEDSSTILLEKFMEQLQEASIMTTQCSFMVNNETVTIGLVVEKSLLLMDWGYSHSKTVLLMEVVVVLLLLGLLGIYFVWKAMKMSKEIKNYKKEVVNLNCKIEEVNQELRRNAFEKETVAVNEQEFQYDTNLMKLLLEKANESRYLPVSMIHIQFDMGDLYFTKNKMKEIEEKLYVELTHRYELLEIGKGEFVLFIIRTEIEVVMQSHIAIEERARSIANENGIKVTVKSRTITKVMEEPLIELEKIRKCSIRSIEESEKG